MVELHIVDAVDALILHSCWECFCSIDCPIYIELVREFYSTFEFTPPAHLSTANAHVYTHPHQLGFLGSLPISVNHFQAPTLILGHLITHLAVLAQLLDPACPNLHVSCTPQPLDIATLAHMGLLTRSMGSFVLLLLARRAPVSVAVSEASPPEDDAVPLASETIHDRLDSIEQRLHRMELNMHAYFEFMHFAPPFSPPR
ncbi:UNVERIFIED_CONTAM: hypothetical protein Slati_1148200 [Sesamum latifolium]|uniref:Uncharacterized protein n=1 Tax=Sesamum latifolium TaxID=2727402 RepID=A0AAW2XDA7_9LAMI